MDVAAKLLIVGFLYIKFWCISPKKSMMSYALAHVPFGFSVLYILVGFGVITYMIMDPKGQLFDTSNPNFFWIASGELPIAFLDIFIAVKVFLMKRGSAKAQILLWKLIGIISVGIAMKIATVCLFMLGFDPYWFFYLVVFPISALIYEMSNSLWVELAKTNLSLPEAKRDSVASSV
jgi:hypothetical protein